MKITIIGELGRDVFVYGDSNRLSPEAPVPVFNPSYTEENPGMAGNVVENLKSMDSSISINFIHQHELITKTRYVEEKSNHMFLRVDEGEGNLTPLTLDDTYIDMIKESDGVIISDYNKGFLTENVMTEIAYHSRFIVVDTKKQISPDTASKFNFIKLNEHEYRRSNDDVKSLYADKLIITLGSKGAKYIDQIIPSTDPRETIDVSGAGDTFTSAFTLNYLKTKNVIDSITFANEMAAIVVSKRGVSTPKKIY
jgi:D-beta-D-heptose 7-phosphate kinase/D-beta-D-heptose 1-phosphate adenosyltransferase